ncbi:MAG: hypothetical protein ACLFTK_00285 [Anaerolineales bacterium]
MSKDFAPVFQRLKAILEPYAASLDVVTDSDDTFYLDTHHIMPNKKPLYFGSATIKKQYVSFYLMPVYLKPELLNDVSEGLKKRMQGKSCFNFKQVDEGLLAELEALAARGYAAYEAEGYIEPA